MTRDLCLLDCAEKGWGLATSQVLTRECTTRHPCLPHRTKKGAQKIPPTVAASEFEFAQLKS